MGSTFLSLSEPLSLPLAGPAEAYTNTLEEYCLVDPVPVQFPANSLPMDAQPSIAEALTRLICCPLSISIDSYPRSCLLADCSICCTARKSLF